jgi:sugar phosphate isomerase/epimerase
MVRTHLHDVGPIAPGSVRISQLDPLIAPLPGTPSPGDVGESMRPLFEVGLTECLDLAEAAGADSVNLAHFRGDPATDPAALCDAVAVVCAAAAERSIRVTFEYFPESAVPDLRAAAELVASVGAENLGLMVDTLHTLRSGGTAEQIAALAPGTVGALQVADRPEVDPDAPYVAMSGRALPGDGVLALVPVVRAALANATPGMPAGIEVFDAGLRALGPRTAAGLAATSMHRLLREVDR